MMGNAAVQVVRVIRPVSWTNVRLWSALATLARHGDLIRTLAAHRLSVRYKQSLLGPLWALAQPFALMLIFTIVFTRLVRMPSDGVPYGVFAYAGLLPWTFFATATTNGTTSLVSHAQLVTKVYFPREILPLTYVVAALCDLGIALGGLVLLGIWFHIPVTSHLVVLIPSLAVLAALATATALLLSAWQVRFRDVGAALPLALQLGLFASPVLYPLSAVPRGWSHWYLLNPLAGAIDAFRCAALGSQPDIHALAISAVAAVLVLPAAYAVFKHTEATVADVV
jgi:lipopolysaccharide transport system permease protein